jgi:hypothetical protein
VDSTPEKFANGGALLQKRGKGRWEWSVGTRSRDASFEHRPTFPHGVTLLPLLAAHSSSQLLCKVVKRCNVD